MIFFYLKTLHLVFEAQLLLYYCYFSLFLYYFRNWAQVEGLSTASINPLLCARSGVHANLQTLCSLGPYHFWTLHHMLLQLLCDLVINTETLEKVVTTAKDIFQLWGTSCNKLRFCWRIGITCFSVGINHCYLGCSFHCGDHKPLTSVCPLLSAQCALSDFQQISPQEKQKANHISMLTLWDQGRMTRLKVSQWTRWFLQYLKITIFYNTFLFLFGTLWL